jgi:hypothetical protein
MSIKSYSDNISFQYDDVIEIDYEDFVVYKIRGQWFAKHNDSEVYDEEILLEDPDQDLYFKTQEIFSTIISEEEFSKFRELE